MVGTARRKKTRRFPRWLIAIALMPAALIAVGVPTISGVDRADLAYATGFLHAQDRFFQMDLLRRAAAGELSELVGPAALDLDRRHRLHRFRNRALAALAAAPP